MRAWLKYLDKGLIPFLFLVLIYLAFNMQRNAKYGSYQDVIWADAAGYHMYNPGLFLYGFEGDQFPDGVIAQVGDGFEFHETTGRAVTKYTYGVAVMQMPFFLLAHAAAHAFDEPTTGYSRFYYWAVMFAAVFWGVFGLWFLKRFLKKYYSPGITLSVVFFTVVATNFYYYMVDDGGMSHAYSFFLFAMGLFYADRYYEKPDIRSLLGFALPLGLAIMIRPTAALFGLFILLYGISNRAAFTQRIKFWLTHWKHAGLALLACAIFWIPHLLYNHYVTGEWQLWTYHDEGFIYAGNPKFAEVLFSPFSGAFPYVPALGLYLIALILMVFRKGSNGWQVLLVFLVATYLFASWHAWHFGSSFGQRSYVEYLVLLAMPLAWLLKQAFARNSLYGLLLLFSLLCCSLWTLRLEYSFDERYFGDIWDYTLFWNYFKF